MSRPQVDDVIRQALHDSAEGQWAPDVNAAYAKFQHQARSGGTHTGHHQPSARSRWTAGVLSAAAAAAVVLIVNITATSFPSAHPSTEDPVALAPDPPRPDPAAPLAVADEGNSKERKAQPPLELDSPPGPKERKAEQPYAPEQVCGPGYRIIDEHGLERSVVYLLWNSATQQNCVVTLKTRDLGHETPTTAYVQADGAPRVTDSGRFAYYAGPVLQKAPGCVRWGGSDVVGPAFDGYDGHCSN